MRIAFASDLHFEFYRRSDGWLPPLPDKCDILVLAGDISVGNDVLDALNRILYALPECKIIWVAGNHEFYKRSIDSQIENYRAACASNDRLYFLENESITIKGYQFLGCTLWSGFDCLGKEQQEAALQEAQNVLPDFSLIRNLRGKVPFRAVDALAKFKESYAWLESELNICDASKTIVVTHFPPLRKLRHQEIPEDLLSAYFQADCEALITKHQPTAWIYGHNHYSDDLTIGKTFISSNQHGYPGEQGIPPFDPNKLLRLKV